MNGRGLFIARFHWISIEVVCLCCLVVAWLMPRETATVSAHVLCTPCNHALVYRVTLFEATYVGACVFCCILPLALQSDRFSGRNLLRATAVTLGWNGYRNKNQHRKLTLEKKILPPILPGRETETFRSRVRRSTVESSRTCHPDRPSTSCPLRMHTVCLLGQRTRLKKLWQNNIFCYNVLSLSASLCNQLPITYLKTKQSYYACKCVVRASRLFGTPNLFEVFSTGLSRQLVKCFTHLFTVFLTQ